MVLLQPSKWGCVTTLPKDKYLFNSAKATWSALRLYRFITPDFSLNLPCFEIQKNPAKAER
jgi:hypothetical protein